MEKIFAFTDEYGAFGYDYSKDGVSTHFIITAIIVKERDVDSLTKSVELIRKKHFQTGEMKSSKVKKNHKRRLRIIQDLINLPFQIFPVIIDKSECERMPGLKYKKSFYKFMNNILHKELRRSFPNLTIVADEICGSDYMKSFINYVYDKQEFPNLLGETEFSFSNSHDNVLIQLADIICGTLSFVYDLKQKTYNPPDYLNILNSKIMATKLYPKTFNSYVINTCAIAEDYDEVIANLCFRQAVLFLNQYKEKDDNEEIKAQIIVLDYLLFRFMNNDTRGYISTKELKSQLYYMGYGDIPISTFRLKIICKLRDNGVIIASSPKGYKIPSKKSELYDYINLESSIVTPLLDRLKKCRDLVKTATNNELDLLDHDEFKHLKHYFDNYKEN